MHMMNSNNIMQRRQLIHDGWKNCMNEYELRLFMVWYEYPINPVKPWARMLHPHPLKRSMSSSINPKPGASSLGYVRVSRASACAMLCDHAGSTPAMRTMPAQLRHTRP